MTTARRITAAAVIATGMIASTRIGHARAAQGDHWKFVPPLATNCFPNDDFLDKLNAATTALNAERERQETINAAAKAKFDAMDMTEKAQRMQAFMMKNPQAAMKMMQAEQAAAAAVSSGVVGANERSGQLTAELASLKANFKTALEQAVKPVRDRRGALIAAKTVAVGEVGEPMFVNAADHAQYVQLIAEENTAIERACVPFFGANGAFHKWLASWRTEVTEKIIAAGGSEDPMVMQMEAMGLPDGGYRSTSSLQQVGNYLRTIGDVYGVRPNRVNPTVGLRK